MKKLLSVVFLLVILCGCSKDSYYTTAEEAYLKGARSQYASSVEYEVDHVELEESILWIAVVSGKLGDSMLFTAFMETEDGRFRLNDDFSSSENYIKPSEAAIRAFSEDGWNHVANGEKDYMFQWVSFDSLTEELKSTYNCKEYELEINGDVFEVVLVLAEYTIHSGK